jgi:hypothetical protein
MKYMDMKYLTHIQVNLLGHAKKVDLKGSNPRKWFIQKYFYKFV